jgi:cation diffusion facilitator CzcD-associated flavoprotein CzcO
MSPRTDTTPTRTAVVVIGSGFAGLGTAIRLKQAGIQDFVILEGEDEVGGTWRDNTYPGAACDIQSHLYSFSFEPNPDWSKAYSPQPEIQRYLVHCADRYGLRDHLYTGAWVLDATWDDQEKTWTVTTEDGRVWIADAMVGAIGGLRDPKYPAIPGRDRFEGTVMHSARWDHDVDLAGKRVAVVGTGASAVQIVPAIAEAAEHVTLMQRTPPWILPRNQHDYPTLLKQAFRHVPGLRRLHRTQLYWQNELRFAGFGRLNTVIMPLAEKLSAAYMRSQVSDPELRAKVTPDYRLGCKRMLISDDYYPSLTRDDVDVVTDGIAEITPTGLVTTTGDAIDVDVIVYCTGFQIEAPLGRLTVRGRGGTTMREAWGDRPIAWMGVAMPGFPNSFLLVGPNSGLGHNSIIFMIESQLNHVIPAIQRIVQGDVAEVDLRPEALQRFQDEVDRRSQHTVWASGCDSWYLGEDGVNYTLWPGSTAEYRVRMARFDPRPYRITKRSDLPAREPQPATA